MWLRRASAAASVVLLAVGGAMVGVAATAAEQAIEDQRTWAMPNGRVGDAWAYAWSEVDAPLAAGQDWGDPERSGTWGGAALGVAPAHDRWANQRTAVQVAVQDPRHTHTRAVYHVATDLRAAIRMDYTTPAHEPLNPEADPHLTQSEFGPGMPGTYMRAMEPYLEFLVDPQRTDLGLLAFQGRTLAVGQPAPEVADALRAEAGLTRPGTAVLRERIQVEGTGAVDGAEALVVRWSGAFRWTSPPLQPNDPQQAWVLWWNATAGQEYEFSREFWLARGSAYPLATRDELVPVGRPAGEARSRLTHLVALAQGDGENLPWTAAEDGAIVKPAPPLAEPGAPGTPPQVSHASFCYTLEEALADMQTRPAAIGYRAWAQAHPDARLALAQGHCSRPQWFLEFVDPATGSACQFSVVRDLDDHVAETYVGGMLDRNRACAAEPWTREPFDPASLPRMRAGFDYAAQLYWDVQDPWLPDVPLGLFTWGTNNVPMSRGWNDVVHSGRALSVTQRFIEVDGQAAPSQPVGTPGGVLRVSGIHVHTETGELLHAGQDYGNLDPRITVLAGRVAAVLGPVLDAVTGKDTTSTPKVAPPRLADPVPAAVAGASGMLILGLLLLLLPAVKFAASRAWVAGYARITGDELLDHPTRAMLLQAVQADPGITPPELQRRFGLAWNTLVHHIVALERGGLVDTKVIGRHKHVFAAGLAPAQRTAAAVLRHPRSARLLAELHRSPGVGRRDLARVLGASVTATVWHLERLLGCGLVQRVESGGAVTYLPASGSAGTDGSPPVGGSSGAGGSSGWGGSGGPPRAGGSPSAGRAGGVDGSGTAGRSGSVGGSGAASNWRAGGRG